MKKKITTTNQMLQFKTVVLSNMHEMISSIHTYIIGIIDPFCWFSDLLALKPTIN